MAQVVVGNLLVATALAHHGKVGLGHQVEPKRQILGRLFQNSHGPTRGGMKLGCALDRNAAFEHRHVVAWIFAGKGQIGAALRLE